MFPRDRICSSISSRAAPSHQEEIYYWERIVIAKLLLLALYVHNRIHYNNIQRIHLHLQRRLPQPWTPRNTSSSSIQQPNENQREQPSFGQDNQMRRRRRRRQGWWWWWTERNGGKGHPFESAFALPQFYCRGSAAGRSVLYVALLWLPSWQRRRPTDLNDNYLSTPSTAQHSTQCISISCSSPSLANNFLFYFGFFPPLLQLSWLVAKREKSQRHLVVCSQYSSNTVHPPPAISNNTIRKKHAVAGDCEQNNGHQRQDKTDTLLEEGEYCGPLKGGVNLDSRFRANLQITEVNVDF